jgi:hypothetical protein
MGPIPVDTGRTMTGPSLICSCQTAFSSDKTSYCAHNAAVAQSSLSCCKEKVRARTRKCSSDILKTNLVHCSWSLLFGRATDETTSVMHNVSTIMLHLDIVLRTR